MDRHDGHGGDHHHGHHDHHHGGHHDEDNFSSEENLLMEVSYIFSPLY